MQKLSHQKIKQILETNHVYPSVTIYMPTTNTFSPEHLKENQSRFKNLFIEALKELDQIDKHNRFNFKFEEWCLDLLENKDFWNHTTEGIVFLAREGRFEYFHLPIDTQEYVSISDNFYLAPIIGIVENSQPYYLLSISKQDPKIYYGDMYGLSSTDIELPKDVNTALNIDERHQKSIQYSSNNSSTNSSRNSMYHGHGGAKDIGDEDLIHFYRIVEKEIRKSIDKSLPIVLSGTSHEVNLFKANTKLPKLCASSIERRYHENDIDKLTKQAQGIIDCEYVEPKHNKLIQNFSNLFSKSNNRKATNKIALVNDDAEHGRVDTLLLGMIEETKDTIRETKHAVKKIVFPSDQGLSKLINHAAQATYEKGGKILSTTKSKIPSDTPIIAINRY